MKTAMLRLAMLSAVTVICLALLEGASRLVIDPVDVLVPVLTPDSVLRWRVEPGSAGHDEWGYRNHTVPDDADIVVIGDSQSYGVGASAVDSWPSWLGRLSGRSVYNLSLGGYGPVDYWR
jgi:hypothetical protein